MELSNVFEIGRKYLIQTWNAYYSLAEVVRKTERAVVVTFYGEGKDRKPVKKTDTIFYSTIEKCRGIN